MSGRLKWPSGSRRTPPRLAVPKLVDFGVCQSHECGMRSYESMHLMGAVSEFHPLRLKKEDDNHDLHHRREREDPSPDINISSLGLTSRPTVRNRSLYSVCTASCVMVG